MTTTNKIEDLVTAAYVAVFGDLDDASDTSLTSSSTMIANFSVEAMRLVGERIAFALDGSVVEHNDADMVEVATKVGKKSAWVRVSGDGAVTYSPGSSGSQYGRLVELGIVETTDIASLCDDVMLSVVAEVVK